MSRAFSKSARTTSGSIWVSGSGYSVSFLVLLIRGRDEGGRPWIRELGQGSLFHRDVAAGAVGLSPWACKSALNALRTPSHKFAYAEYQRPADAASLAVSIASSA